MKNREGILILTGVVALGVLSAFLFPHRIKVHLADDPIAKTIINMQHPHSISRINVLSGDEFDITLSDSRRVHAVLDVKATPEAKEKVKSFISKCTNPKVLLKNKQKDVWVVQMYFTTIDKQGRFIEVDLSKWIQNKNLAYSTFSE